MKIELKNITVRELADGYSDNQEGGVTGYAGKLDVRPPYQREFIYKDKQRDAVIDTINRGFPLNVMYWSVQADDAFEVIDGQQRTISVCQYVVGDFGVNGLAFHNLPEDKQRAILDYELMVYVCSGTDSEKLEWFKTINIAGEELTAQELRNAVYSGPWVSDAKKYFSRNGAPAYAVGSPYLSGSPIRQDYLETAIKWINNWDIAEYMSAHQHDPNAGELWRHFRSVIDWVEATFPKHRKEMKGRDWGRLYDEHQPTVWDATKLEKQIAGLMADEDVTDKKGIYEYVLSGREKHLNIRAFSPNQKREAFERQGGVCPNCGETFLIEAMEGDHITPWSAGGKTDAANCKMLCQDCNRRKGAN